MTISKQLLNNLPTPAPTDPGLAPPSNQAIERLEQRIADLESKLAFAAEFEATLSKAIQNEIDLLGTCEKRTTSEAQRMGFKVMGSSLSRIRKRWLEGVSYGLDPQKMAIVEKGAS